MTVTGFITAIIIGAIIGVLGRLVVPGRQNIGMLLTVLVGIVAAVIGTLIVGPLSSTRGIDWIEIVVQVLLAAVGVYLVSAMRGRRRV